MALIYVGDLAHNLSVKLSHVCVASVVVSYPDPPPKRKVKSGEYITALHHGLAVAMDSTKS